MSDYSNQTKNGFCDAVPIKVNRVFDSCSSRDCLANLMVSALTTPVPNGAIMVKSRSVYITNVCVNIEPIQFNKGFYSVDLTYTISLDLAFYGSSCTAPLATSTGTVYANKHCILYGGEGNTQTFCNNTDFNSGTVSECCNNITNLPTACVHVINPICLECKLVTNCVCPSSATTRTTPSNVFVQPENCQKDVMVSAVLPNTCCSCDSKVQQTDVVVTLGLFSIVELTRPSTVLVPTYPYTIPQKECCTNTKSPCEIFDKMQFPTEEFTTPSVPLQEQPNYLQCTATSVNSVGNINGIGSGMCQSCDSCSCGGLNAGYVPYTSMGECDS